MGLKITKVAVDNSVKAGKGLEAFEQLKTGYVLRYAPSANRYSITMYGQNFTGIGLVGLIEMMQKIVLLGLKIKS